MTCDFNRLVIFRYFTKIIIGFEKVDSQIETTP